MKADKFSASDNVLTFKFDIWRVCSNKMQAYTKLVLENSKAGSTRHVWITSSYLNR